MSEQLLLADNRYRDRLMCVTTPEDLDKWFTVASHCFLGGSCSDCCAFHNHICKHNPSRCPFCKAFTCIECGCDCSKPNFGWLQDLLDRAEAARVWG